MSSQEGFRLGSVGGGRWLELSDDAPASHDRVALAAMLDAVEQVGKAPRCLSCGHLNHLVRRADIECLVNLTAHPELPLMALGRKALPRPDHFVNTLPPTVGTMTLSSVMCSGGARKCRGAVPLRLQR